ncbi:endonuclease/exonuclease/phosphatase family protein, partial [bacterium]|nr:endonuclease/exonuclease/phosphatase family protein [bacterium]
MKSVKSLLWLFSVLYLGILCVLWASPYWPARLGWLANLFQMAPLWVLYFPLGFLFIIWLFVRKTGILIVNIVSFAVIFFCIMGFNVPFSVPWQKAQNAQDQLRIMTFNLGTNVDATSLAEFIAKVEPDIIAFQEVYTDSQNALKLILPQDEGWYLSFQQYLGLASRLKIRNVDVKNRSMLGGRGEMVAKYELELEGENNGYINFFNVHLETPRDGLEAVIDNKMGGVSEVRRVAELQKKESGFISEWIESHDAVLIAGDFNMLEISPLYKKYWSSFT